MFIKRNYLLGDEKPIIKVIRNTVINQLDIEAEARSQ